MEKIEYDITGLYGGRLMKRKVETVYTILARQKDRGVGFYINKNIKNDDVLEIKGVSERTGCFN